MPEARHADPVRSHQAFVDHPDVPVPNAAGGPLAGVTFAVKDIYDVAGYVTGCGNVEKMGVDPPAAKNASSEQRLLDASAK